MSVDNASPWSYSWNTSGLAEGSNHTIEARAYALYATPNMMRSDEIVVVYGGDEAPLPPKGLTVIDTP